MSNYLDPHADLARLRVRASLFANTVARAAQIGREYPGMADATLRAIEEITKHFVTTYLMQTGNIPPSLSGLGKIHLQLAAESCELRANSFAEGEPLPLLLVNVCPESIRSQADVLLDALSAEIDERVAQGLQDHLEAEYRRQEYEANR